MRVPLGSCLIAAWIVLFGTEAALGQWDWNKTRARGMFGDRTLGETIKPRPSSRFGNSFWRGPSGNFLGRDATRPGMMFPSAYGQPEFQPRYRPLPPAPAPEILPVFPGEAPAPARFEQPLEQPQLEEAPQMWFRGRSPPGEGGGSMAAPSFVPEVAAGAGGGPATVGYAASGGGVGAVPRLSTTMALGFPPAGSVDGVLTATLKSQIAKIPRFQTGEPISVSVSSGLATLQGSVATQHDRKVLAEFVRMEPGVWEVDNQLTVQP